MAQLLLVLVVGGSLAAMTIVVWLIGVLTGGDTTPSRRRSGLPADFGVIRAVSRQRAPTGRR
jgi:hypothetical protein